MARLLHGVVTRALVVVLAGTAVLALPACLDADRGPVPPALIGVWQGGAHTNGDWCHEFSADGTYRTWPVRAPGAVNTGTVVVDRDTLLFSNGGAPVRLTWSLANGVLLLDGQIYVRAPSS